MGESLWLKDKKLEEGENSGHLIHLWAGMPIQAKQRLGGTNPDQEPPTPSQGQDSDSRLERPSQKWSSGGTRQGDQGSDPHSPLQTGPLQGPSPLAPRACPGKVTTPRSFCRNSLCYLRKGHQERPPGDPHLFVEVLSHPGPEASGAPRTQTQSLQPSFPRGSQWGQWGRPSTRPGGVGRWELKHPSFPP